MASPLYIEENAVDSVITYLKAQLPTAINEINAVSPANQQMVMFKKIYDDLLAPDQMDPLPSACVFVEESEDDTRNRTLRINTSTIHVLFAYLGHGRIGYRYASAITSITQRDPTYGATLGRVNVSKREFFHPVSKGNLDIRVAEVVLEIQQEVKRS